MAAQPQLPPANSNPKDSGNDAACSNEEYKGWWVRGKEIYDYLRKLPKRVSAELDMGDLHASLLKQWRSKVQNPSVVGQEVSAETLGALLLWIRQSETLVYYVTYRDKGNAIPGPTTPGILKVQEEPETTQWHWPWIPGWDDPNRRAQLLNPNSNKWSTKKKVLIFGGVGLAAFIMGKKLLNTAVSEY